jgi:NADH:ubiquinone oxidoreductase subunit 6 (subunit J)
MIFKIIALLAAAIPIFLFVRSVFFQRTTRVNEGLREFKKQANLAVSIFLFLIVCVVIFAAGKLATTKRREVPCADIPPGTMST